MKNWYKYESWLSHNLAELCITNACYWTSGGKLEEINKDNPFRYPMYVLKVWQRPFRALPTPMVQRCKFQAMFDSLKQNTGMLKRGSNGTRHTTPTLHLSNGRTLSIFEKGYNIARNSLCYRRCVFLVQNNIAA